MRRSLENLTKLHDALWEKQRHYLGVYVMINNKQPNRTYARNVLKILERLTTPHRFSGRGRLQNSPPPFVKAVLENKHRCPKCRKFRKFRPFSLTDPALMTKPDLKTWEKQADNTWICGRCRAKVSSVVPVERDVPQTENLK